MKLLSIAFFLSALLLSTIILTAGEQKQLSCEDELLIKQGALKLERGQHNDMKETVIAYSIRLDNALKEIERLKQELAAKDETK